MKNFTLWLAQGLGSGRIPFGPGTWGSVVGLLWFALLLKIGSPIVFFIGLILSVPVSVWASAEAEKILREKDPGSVVIDEIIAIPLCFVSWLAILFFKKGTWPESEYFFTAPAWRMTLAIFVLFRIFDIAKPWPIRHSQNFPGGWGVTLDDLLAAVYVNLVILVAWIFKPGWF